MSRKSEDGFAALTALVAAAAFAGLAVEITAHAHAAAVSAAADARRTRDLAAVEAGYAMALAGLQDQDAGARWTIDGEPKTLDFGDATLTVRTEDEWGKIPLNTLSRSQARVMFAAAGAREDADDLAEAFLQARHDPGEPGTPAATSPGFDAVSDLKAISGMTPGLYAAIAPSATVFARDAAFEPRTATPLALEVMTGAAPGSPEVIARARVLKGESPALDTGPLLRLAGRPLTLRVRVEDAGGGALERAEVVELTRSPTRPYVVRGLAEAVPGA